jgi:hypothetical protein
MVDLVALVAEKVGIDTELSSKAVGTMLALVQSDGDPQLVGKLMTFIPEAEGLADAGIKDGGGFMSKIGGALGGGAMGAFGKLMSAGLDPTQIQAIAEVVFDHAKERAGEELVSEVVSSVPGLAQYV